MKAYLTFSGLIFISLLLTSVYSLRSKSKKSKAARLFQAGSNTPYMDILRVGQSIYTGQALISPNGRYEAQLETAGYFSVYDSEQVTYNGVKWRAGYTVTTMPKTLIRNTANLLFKVDLPVRLTMENNGKFAIYDKYNRQIWTPTILSQDLTSGVLPYYLRLQDDGNMVIYDSVGKAIWAITSYTVPQSN